jgi:hypothetical protein
VVGEAGAAAERNKKKNIPLQILEKIKAKPYGTSPKRRPWPNDATQSERADPGHGDLAEQMHLL